MCLQLVLLAMSEWYMQAESDQSRLSRILDVAQDLKALSVLLNAQSFPFVIDLACLAFRRESTHSPSTLMMMIIYVIISSPLL